MKAQNLVMIALLVISAGRAAAEPPVEGVFGIVPVPESAALAIWVPLAEGSAVEAVRWYNNDSTVVFPSLLAVAGDVDHPELLADAVIVAENVVGTTSDWSQCQLAQPVASETAGLYLIFRVPLGSDFQGEGEGGGAGFGYCIGNGERRCWFGTDAETWNPLTADYQMAVEAVVATNKSGNALVLARPRHDSDVSRSAEVDLAVPGGMIAAPNPFNPKTELRFSLPQDENVDLVIYDLLGREIRRLFTGSLTQGSHCIPWDGLDNGGRMQASGVYLARLTTESMRFTMRLALVR